MNRPLKNDARDDDGLRAHSFKCEVSPNYLNNIAKGSRDRDFHDPSSETVAGRAADLLFTPPLLRDVQPEELAAT